MYCEFYGLKENPFNVTSDPSFFFFSKSHKEALSHLVYGIEEKKGIIAVTGEIGTGKTTLCRVLLNRLCPTVKTAFIINPHFSQIQLLKAIIDDFGINTTARSRLSLVVDLNNFLLKEAEAGNNAVIIIDEAQNLWPRELEQIRLLSNLETEKSKLLQIVLVGQPELNHRLELYCLRQVRQRIMVKYHISPLEKQEVIEYINHRLKVAGSNGEISFNEGMVEEIYGFSRGTPRLINFICDRIMLAGFASGIKNLDHSLVTRCIDEANSALVNQ